MKTVKERVAKSIAVLDRLKPSWWEKVDSENILWLEGKDACVLSQVYGNWNDGYNALRWAGATDEELLGLRVDCDNCTGAFSQTIERIMLAHHWRNAIRKRKREQKKPHPEIILSH